jgi:hypothetical protein
MIIEELIDYIDHNAINKILVTGPNHSGSEDMGRMLSSSYGYLYFDREHFFNKNPIPILQKLFDKYDKIICHCPDLLPNDLEVFTVVVDRNTSDIESDRIRQHYDSYLTPEEFYSSWSDSECTIVKWEEYKHIRIPKIYGFWHVAFMNEWQFIVQKQLAKIKNSGLIDKTEKVYVSCLGEKSEVKVLKGMLNGVNHELLYEPDLKQYEMVTLQYMKDMSINEDFNCWYIHTKGASIPKNHQHWVQKQSWRSYMEEFIINQHERCLDMLSYYDAIGVNKNENNRSEQHFQGNFWWTKSSAVRTLGDLWKKVKRDGGKFRNHIRMNAEFWFGTNPELRLHSLYNLDIHGNHMLSFIDFEV